MKKMEIIMIQVSDQQKAKAFYLKLGFEVILEAPMGNGETWLQMGLPGEAVTISLGNSRGIIIETGDIEKEVADLKAKGIDAGKVDDTPWGKFAWVNDPDGNGWSLHQR